MTFQAPALPPVERPIQSLVSKAQKQEPEVTAFSCVDPVETAADKLSALAWRVCARERGAHDDDPTIVRHLHDLAALEPLAMAALAFTKLVLEASKADTGRGGNRAPANPAERFALMYERLAKDPLWADEYEEFVHSVSFAGPGETITFHTALEAASRLIAVMSKCA